MGITNRTLVREGLSIRRSNTKEQAKMFFKVLTSASLISLSALAAPQYAAQTGSVQCRTEYATLWDTEYKETETEECITEYEKVCRTETQRLCQPTTRQECNTVYEMQCSTVYKNECVEQYKTEYEPYTETECVTEYKEDCEYQWEGHGHDKVWAPIAGTCKRNPYKTCVDVAKTKEKQVAYPVCNDVPQQKCVSVPRQECVTVLTKFAPTNHCGSARMYQDRRVRLFIRSYLSGLAGGCLKKSAKMDTQGIRLWMSGIMKMTFSL